MARKSPKKRDTKQPKKPKTAFFLFCDTKREEVKKSLTEKSSNKIPASKISAALGELWNNLPDEKKKKFNDVYKKNLEFYKTEIEEYNKNKAESSDESSEEEAKKKRKRKPKKDKNAPKRPLSSYMIFSKDHRQKIVNENGKLKVTEVAKLIGEAWKKMSDDEKSPYVKKANILKGEYDEKVKKYKSESQSKKKPKKESESESEQESSDESSSD